MHVRPQIAHLGDAAGHGPELECARTGLAALNLLPRARRRYRRAWPRPHRVRRSEGRAVTIASGIDQDPSAAIGLAELLREMLRVALDQDRAGAVGEPRDLAEVVLAVKRDDDVESLSSPMSSPSSSGPARAGGAQPERGCAQDVRLVLGRVEIENADVGVVEFGARDVHTCGVMQFWLASQSSERVSQTSGWCTVPPFLGTSTRSSQSGNPFETFFCMKPCSPMPLGKRSIVTGRARMCGSMMGAMVS